MSNVSSEHPEVVYLIILLIHTVFGFIRTCKFSILVYSTLTLD